MRSVYCTRCGQANLDGARFCSHCGTMLARMGGDRPGETTSTISLGGGDLGDAEDGDQSLTDSSAPQTQPPGTALLVGVRGPNAGRPFLRPRGLTPARRPPEADILLD